MASDCTDVGVRFVMVMSRLSGHLGRELGSHTRATVKAAATGRAAGKGGGPVAVQQVKKVTST
jgi:hypothetical protein